MKKSRQNPVAVAMQKRYSTTTTVMGDRRAPRGGSHNEMVELLLEYEDDSEGVQSVHSPEGVSDKAEA